MRSAQDHRISTLHLPVSSLLVSGVRHNLPGLSELPMPRIRSVQLSVFQIFPHMIPPANTGLPEFFPKALYKITILLSQFDYSPSLERVSVSSTAVPSVDSPTSGTSGASSLSSEAASSVESSVSSDLSSSATSSAGSSVSSDLSSASSVSSFSSVS